MDMEKHTTEAGENAWRIAHEGQNENGGVPISSDELAVQRRAYALWEQRGRPEGKQHEHWAQARQELGSAQ